MVMFKVGDIIKAKMDVAEDQYAGCKGTIVYDKMMELALTKRFKIVGETKTHYEVLHVGENVQNSHPRTEVHELFELANDSEPSS